MDFGKVLSRSWHIIWNNKVLWIFGILASCGSRSGSSGGGGNMGSSFQYNSGDAGNLPPQMQRFFIDMQRAFERIPQDRLILYGLIFVFAILLLVLITWLIGLYGKTALIKGAVQADSGQRLAFRQLWSDAWVPFGRVVGLNTLLGLIGLFGALIVVVPLVLLVAVTAGIGFLCVLPLLCIIIPVAIAFSVYGEVANVALVTEGLGATDAMERAWRVFRSNLGSFALLALILVVGGFIANIFIAIPLFIAFAPLIAGVLSSNQQSFSSGLNIFLICLVVYIPVLLVLNGIVQSYLQSAWTLGYRDLTGAAAVASRKPSAPRKTIAAKSATRKK